MIKITQPPEGGKGPAAAPGSAPPSKPGLDTTADIRDAVSALVGAGYTGKTADPELAAHRDFIIRTLPAGQGQNLLTHIAVQNQTNGFSIMKPEQRISRFYDINSSVPATDDLLRKLKAFGTGPVTGFRDTQDVFSRKLAGDTNPIALKKVS